MPIAGVDDYCAAAKQPIQFMKNQARTTVAGGWFTTFDLTGQPGNGTLAGSNTANGVVPTDADAGYPTINAFGVGNTGHLSRFEFGSNVACRIQVFDCVFMAGAYSFNSNVALASQPSFASRVPGGTDFTGCELWLGAVTAHTGNLTVSGTYTNGAGTAGKTYSLATGTALTVGRCMQVPLAAGEGSGIQKLESVVGSVATVGTFNMMILRPLASGRVRINNDGDVLDFLKTGLRQVWENSAIMVMVAPDSTAIGQPEMLIEIANK